MRHVSKDIPKHYQIACSSMSYTLFDFYRIIFYVIIMPFAANEVRILLEKRIANMLKI